MSLVSMSSVYSTHSTLQNSAIQYAMKSLLPFMKEKVRNSNALSLVKVADFGSATGENSQLMMKEIVQEASVKNIPIELTFCDVPSNNFSKLFQNFANQEAFNADNVFVQAVGRSFYQKNFADGQLDISYSSTAYHWLDSTKDSSRGKSALKRTRHISFHALPDEDRNEFYRDVVSRDFDRNEEGINE